MLTSPIRIKTIQLHHLPLQEFYNNPICGVLVAVARCTLRQDWRSSRTPMSREWQRSWPWYKMHHHPIHWNKSSVLHGSWQEVRGSANPDDTSTGWDGGMNVPSCWTTVMKRLEEKCNPDWPLTFKLWMALFTLLLYDHANNSCLI